MPPVPSSSSSDAAVDPKQAVKATQAAGWGSILGGLAIVGAAAGYAALALRFRNLGLTGSLKGGPASAEIRAANKFARDWEKAAAQAETFGSGGSASGGSASGADAESAKEGGRETADDTQGRRSKGGGAREGARAAYANSRRERAQAPMPPFSGQAGPGWAYLALGLKGGETPTEAKAAYRQRAKLVHPDLAGLAANRAPQAADDEAFKRLQQAYTAVLQDMKSS